MQAHPGIIAASMPWLSGLDYKRLCSWMPYVSVVLVLTRDKGSGRVTIGADGLPRVHYWPSKQDRQSMMNVSPALSLHAMHLAISSYDHSWLGPALAAVVEPFMGIAKV